MNIFWLHSDFRLSARLACDQHICKMITEHTQLICTSLREFGLSPLSMKSTHTKHPCSLWLQEDFANLVALYSLNEAYFEEYLERYDKPHKGFLKMIYDVSYHGWPKIRQEYYSRGLDKHRYETLRQLRENPIEYMTTPPQAIPEDVKRPLIGKREQDIQVVIKAYRTCYVVHKSTFARYLHSPTPKFMIEAIAKNQHG